MSAVAIVVLLRARSTEPASVLLVTLDTFRADRLRAYGGPPDLAPTLNDLAAKGVVFADASTAVPVTLPSHSTILSGLFPLHHGVHVNGTDHFPPDIPTLAERFRAGGFATAAFVGAFVLDRRFGLDRGFEVYDDAMPPVRRGNDPIFAERRCGDVVAPALRWLRGNQRRFFAWVHFYDAHAPYAPPPPFDTRYADRTYDGEVAYVDSCVAEVLRTARERSPGPLTVVVVGDHGEGLGDHGEMTHGLFVYQSTVKVPFFIAGAGIGEPRIDTRPARTADVAPTLLALARLPPLSADGVDLLHADPGAAYMETDEPGLFGWASPRALRDGRWKLIQLPKPELYDLHDDPAEAHNRVADSTPVFTRFAQALQLMTRAPRTTRASIDPASAERLAALGYVTAPSSEDPGVTAGRVLRDPKDALPTWRLFESANINRDPEGVIRGLHQALATEPDNLALLRSLALAYRRLGRAAEEAPVRERVVALVPGDCAGWHELSLARAGSGEMGPAGDAAGRAITCDPKAPAFQNQMAAVDTMAGRHLDALRHLDAAIALDPGKVSYRLNRAHALWSLQRRQDALDGFRAILAREPSHPGALVAAGGLEAEMGLLDDAAVHLRAALGVSPDPRTMFDLADVLARRGQSAEARGLAETALSLSPPADVRERLQQLIGRLPR